MVKFNDIGDVSVMLGGGAIAHPFDDRRIIGVTVFAFQQVFVIDIDTHFGAGRAGRPQGWLALADQCCSNAPPTRSGDTGACHKRRLYWFERR